MASNKWSLLKCFLSSSGVRVKYTLSLFGTDVYLSWTYHKVPPKQFKKTVKYKNNNFSNVRIEHKNTCTVLSIKRLGNSILGWGFLIKI